MRLWLLAAIVAAGCGRSEPAPPPYAIHLERWDGAGMPVVGDIDITVRGFDEKSVLATATSTVEVVCDPCVIEEHRLAPPPARNARMAAFVADGIGFPRVDLGMVRGELRLAGGRAEIEGRAVGGPALEITMSGTIELAARMAESKADIRFLLRPTRDIATAAPELANILALLGPPDASGAIPIHMRGPMSRLRAVR